MLIKEVCKITGLTRKAIEYYEEKGLIAPRIEDNGYRNFSKEDVKRLKEISLLRKLGLNIAEIRSVLDGENKRANLAKIKYQKDLELQKDKRKQELLNQLIEGKNLDEIIHQIEHLDKQQTIMEKLLNAFPGYYGRFLALHFGRFMNSRILTKEQEIAYNTVVEFLDSVENFRIPPELEKFFEDATSYIDTELMESITTNMIKAVEDIDDYIEQNKDILEQYIVYKNSEEYKQSPLYKIQSLLLEFQRTNRYYDVFISNMRKLSPSYDEYYKKLERANEKFVEQYPEVSTWYSK
ncbi:MAG: MerR family transcriptional regulator [Firmicutes bacterium]|nr:MerR family transcriptional regulator [Bacillota bacterium]